MKRRKFIKALGLGAAALLGIGMEGMFIDSSRFEVVHQPLHLPRLDEKLYGMRIVQISDIHMGGWMNYARFQQVIGLVLEQQPDLVTITGDFVSRLGSFDQTLNDLAAGLSALTRSVQTVTVMGNHDHWRGVGAIREMISTVKIVELRNQVFSLKKNGATLHLCGVDDVWERKDDLERVIGELPDNQAAILLAHEPDFAVRAARTGRFDLQLSGHTHGGQVVLPFFGAPVLPEYGQLFPAGLYQVGDMLEYTNCGVGMATLQIRFNCRPEITVFTLAG
jgi:uncharacterized protein